MTPEHLQPKQNFIARPPRFKIAVFAMILILVGGAIYSNSLNAPFQLDDFKNIIDCDFIRITSLDSDNFKYFFNGLSDHKYHRALSRFTFAINYYFNGYDVKGYHIFNIAIHLLNALFLLLFIRSTINIHDRLSQKKNKYEHADEIAFLSALIWLVHPLHTQSVTYIVQRMNSLAAMFFLLSLLFYIHARRRQLSSLKTNRFTVGFSFLGCGISALLAVFSKQNAAVLPFFILLYEWFFFQDLSMKWFRQKMLPVILVVVLISIFIFDIYLIDKLTSQFASHEFTLIQRLLTQLRVVVYYLSLMVYPNPNRLNLDYDFPLSYSLIDPFGTMISLSAVLGLITVAILSAPKARLFSFCIMWFFGNLFIESSFIGLALIFEHRTYLPSMLVCLLFIALVFNYMKGIRFRVITISGIVLVLSLWSYQRNSIWADQLTFWKDCIHKSPNIARPYWGLGVSLMDRGKFHQSINLLKESLRLSQDQRFLPDIHVNLGNAFAQSGQFDQAIVHLSKALSLKPEDAKIYYNLGLAMAQAGRIDESINYFTQSLKIYPQNAEAHNNLAAVLARKGNFKEAARHLHAAIKINPDNCQAHFNLCLLRPDIDNINNAMQCLKKALTISPESMDIRQKIKELNKLKKSFRP